jgi:putative Mn2+ efflux pump MntP
MDYISIVFIALALALDAFSVSVGAGSYFRKTTRRQKFRLAFHFGLFQFLMPIIGWYIGYYVADLVSALDHWIALIILSIIGLKMIKDSLEDSDLVTKDITKGLALISLSVATSIDALAVGFSMSLLNQEIYIPSIIIGIVAASMSLLGIFIGETLSKSFGNKANLIGGIILILIGMNIVAEHLGMY